ncbi:aldo/keto reductase [Sphingomonas sp. BIUV-7]|uniref:Aldo/keto reductase n=1 Tax=Sphingomonas natans TaxID=3063330 RepID=A0ABT8Y9R5_9SPHN|nr:aldo/keto reductase [Sphingomonas sp. BIUV-7]MDO6415073.1 aldo/keto reductase [Sphingomonas sp. BIUV-7]
MTDVPTQLLNDGRAIPQLGLGVFQTPPAETEAIVRAALAAGYRYVDTAKVYGNEEGVGAAVRDCPDWVFVTTKLWNPDQGHDSTLAAFDASMKRLGLDELDLYLIHWPVPRIDRFLDSWKAMIRLREERRVRSIGVSNFRIPDLQRLIDETGVVPAVNQVVLHPGFQQRELRRFHENHGIVTTSWSPLGRGEALADPVIGRIAAKHGKTPAQTIIRWHIDSGLNVIPKTANAGRLPENLDVFDFALDHEDLRTIEALDRADGRIGPDPAVMEMGV